MAEENKGTTQNENAETETGTWTAPKGSEGAGNASLHLSDTDYAKLEKLLAGGRQAKEDKTLASYFKEQGLSKDEVQQAIDAFKAERESRKPDVNALTSQLAAEKVKTLEANVRIKAYELSEKLNVDTSKMSYVLKLADLSEVADKEGNISAEKLEEAVGKVLEELPELKKQEGSSSGFKPKVGSDGQGDNNAKPKSTIPAKNWNKWNH